ncbi:MAG: NUDIX domain-containing protein [Candidatus Poribacteria bacterium]
MSRTEIETERINAMIDESWYKRPEGIRERTSSGGVVVRLENDKIHVALVGEIGVPDYVLPKGGVESGENLEQTARREIEEEAGLTSLKLIAKLGTRERLAYDKSCWITTHFYLFLTEQVDGVPTDAEHHYGLAWYPIDALPAIFWPEQRELIETNQDKIAALIKPYLQ